MDSIKVTLRKLYNLSGKVSLYLDFYPVIKNPRTGEESRREHLGIYEQYGFIDQRKAKMDAVGYLHSLMLIRYDESPNPKFGCKTRWFL